MKKYQWPGNVREMENVIERLVFLNRSGIITSDELPRRMQAQSRGTAETASATSTFGRGSIDLAATLASIEGSLLEQALRQAEGNRTRAAELLGLSRTTFIDKLGRR
jgi:DNA-binding NtrC family response regulator